MIYRITSAAVAMLVASAAPTHAVSGGNATSCDVRGAYSVVDVPAGSIALTNLGQPEEISQVLVPTDLKSGAYDVLVTRKGQDLYRVDGTSTYLRTQFCYEYAYAQKAVLRYRSLGAAGSGTLVFD